LEKLKVLYLNFRRHKSVALHHWPGRYASCNLYLCTLPSHDSLPDIVYCQNYQFFCVVLVWLLYKKWRSYTVNKKGGLEWNIFVSRRISSNSPKYFMIKIWDLGWQKTTYKFKKVVCEEILRRVRRYSFANKDIPFKTPLFIYSVTTPFFAYYNHTKTTRKYRK
jgi:hypothetical protein